MGPCQFLPAPKFTTSFSCTKSTTLNRNTRVKKNDTTLNGAPAVTYGEFVSTCAKFDIKRGTAYNLLAEGMLETFTIGTKRYVYLESLETLPQRLASKTKEAQAA